jgi:hypothetical protein
MDAVGKPRYPVAPIPKGEARRLAKWARVGDLGKSGATFIAL